MGFSDRCREQELSHSYLSRDENRAVDAKMNKPSPRYAEHEAPVLLELIRLYPVCALLSEVTHTGPALGAANISASSGLLDTPPSPLL